MKSTALIPRDTLASATCCSGAKVALLIVCNCMRAARGSAAPLGSTTPGSPLKTSWPRI